MIANYILQITNLSEKENPTNHKNYLFFFLEKPTKQVMAELRKRAGVR